MVSFVSTSTGVGRAADRRDVSQWQAILELETGNGERNTWHGGQIRSRRGENDLFEVLEGRDGMACQVNLATP